MRIKLHRGKAYKDLGLFRSMIQMSAGYKPVSRKLNFHVSTNVSITGTIYLKSAVFPVRINMIIYPLNR